MCLNHRRARKIELFAKRVNHGGMVVAYIVNAISGEEIEDAPPVISEQFGTRAALVSDIHFQQVEQPDPLRIYVFGVESTYRRTNAACNHSTSRQA
jgi:hypothetical protein